MWVWIYGCVNDVCMEITGCGGGGVGWRWVCVGGVGGWVSEFWTSGIIYMRIL